VNIILFDHPKTGKTTLFNILTGANAVRDVDVIHFRFVQ